LFKSRGISAEMSTVSDRNISMRLNYSRLDPAPQKGNNNF